jgi:hypothetical protein
MTTVFIAILAFFVLSNVIVEYRNRKLFPPFRTDLSGYLSVVPLHWLQDAGYLVLALALPAIGFYLGGLSVEILFSLACVGLISVVVTKRVIQYAKLGPFVNSDLETAHIASAGVTYGCLTAALLIHSWLQPNVTFICALLAPLSAAAFNRLASGKTALEEKTYTLFLLIAIFAAL